MVRVEHETQNETKRLQTLKPHASGSQANAACVNKMKLFGIRGEVHIKFPFFLRNSNDKKKGCGGCGYRYVFNAISFCGFAKYVGRMVCHFPYIISSLSNGWVMHIVRI